MSIRRLLIANRGEIAIRIVRAAAELGMHTVAVHSEDDASSLHARVADEAFALTGAGAAAYLDGAQLVAAARATGCDAIHPGYGFLSETAAFARQCADAGLTYVGPSPAALDLFGDKVRARAVARDHAVPVLEGTDAETSLEAARAFFDALPDGVAMIVKAVAGGGGRGVRVVAAAGELDAAYSAAGREAQAAFGNPALYVERFLPRARHIEVQVAADRLGAVSHLWERDCSLQRRHQKLVEYAPSPNLSTELRERILEAAVRLAGATRYENLGTIEFLVDAEAGRSAGGGAPAAEAFFFIEANARLQVEHTVTEEVTGVDLVRLQLRLAEGATLAELGLTQDRVPAPRGFAIQARVNMETMTADGATRPAGGTLVAFETPSGPGVRTDTFGYAGYRTSPRYDSLLAKVIAHSTSPDFADAIRKADRALAEFRIEGVGTNIPFLRALLAHPDFAAGRLYTRFVDDHIAELAATAASEQRRLFFDAAPPSAEATPPAAAAAPPAPGPVRAGARVDAGDPLAVLAHGKSGASAPQPSAAAALASPPAPPHAEAPAGTVAVTSPMQGTIVGIDVAEGDLVRAGQQVLVMEAMKMEHVVAATTSGEVRQVAVAAGDTVYGGTPLIFVEERAVAADAGADEEAIDLDAIRPDLAAVHARHAAMLDAARGQAVEKRHAGGHRTARENIEDLCDPGSFVEYGGLALTANTQRSLEDLIRLNPGDGMVCGIGMVNGDRFADPANRVTVISYDYMVLAGTQGGINHRKTDRTLQVAEEGRTPVVFFTEGGGGRAGGGSGGNAGARDSGTIVGGGGGGLDTPTFRSMGKLSGLVPTVGITTGYCFAGNAALLGVCDVVIATAGSNIGMGGPAMIEGGGLGVFRPDEVGPLDVQVANGVVDIAVADEAEAVRVTKQYLSYFQGAVHDWECADQRLLRRVIPENRLRVYDMRALIETMADTGSVLELRRGFGLGMVTSLIRMEGRPLGVIANNPTHLSGAIDSDAADKASRFMQLCDAFDLPILFLCDTPGIMVGPEAEKTATVRHAARMFVNGAAVTVPVVTLVVRKAYGLGAQTMGAGHFKNPLLTVAWPTGEFGGMGLEGQVKLGYRVELEALADAEARRHRYDELVARAYERGKALNAAVSFALDDVIDPADSRRVVTGALHAVRPRPRSGRKRMIDTW